MRTLTTYNSNYDNIKKEMRSMTLYLKTDLL